MTTRQMLSKAALILLAVFILLAVGGAFDRLSYQVGDKVHEYLFNPPCVGECVNAVERMKE
jgi:hypothetical protein